MKVRTFVGIKIPQELSSKIFKFSSEKLKNIKGKIKLVEEQNLHITLLFLGEIEQNKISEIIDELKKIKHERFSIKIKGLGFFPSHELPRVIWLGSESPQITNLYDKIKNKLKIFVQKDDSKSFVSHITIARVKSHISPAETKKLLDENGQLEFGEFEVKEFHLFESKLTPHGPIYKIIESFKLE
jgi:2''-5'' RNA ligase